jgi:membrane fusion protein (multidrug efflux system)
VTGEESLKMPPASFRDRDSSGGQSPSDGETAETEAQIQAATEDRSQSEPVAAESPIADSNDDSNDADSNDNVAPAPRRLSRKPNRRRLIVSIGAIAVIATLGLGARWWLFGRYMISTDDAYVGAHNTTLASKISGYVESIRVPDNATVHAGDVIATIDNGDYQLAVDAAREKAATQQATVDRIGRQVVAQQANVDQAKAQMVSALAEARRTRLELQRQQALAARSFASAQTLEQAIANNDKAAAAIDSAQAMIDAAAANLDVLKAQQQEALRLLDELQTALAKAVRDLSFTVIRAPVDGVFSNRAVQTGDYVQTGQRVASLVPLGEIYIDANFKETQLARIHPGQPVSVSLDAFPQHDIHGRVASLSPASGSVFSLLPPDNATGNFTKIVQRLPVRIELPTGVAVQRVLRPGMSVVVTVNTKPDTAGNAGSSATADTGEDIPNLQADAE